MVLVQQGSLDELRARADIDGIWAAQQLTDVLAKHGKLNELWQEVHAGTAFAAEHLVQLLRIAPGRGC
jgi:hypothetical protein